MATCPKCSSRITLAAPPAPGGKVVCGVCKSTFNVTKPPSRGGKSTVGGPASRPSSSPYPVPEALDLHEGDLFDGRYTIMRVLGSGTFGQVFRAFDETKYRNVALKLPARDTWLDARFLARFRAEAEILGRLEHPHIVKFYGASLDAPPRYLVTEFIEGCNLEEELAEERAAGRRMPRLRALTIAFKLAGALHHAHLQGVVHRDMKPANIMVSRDDVRLTDFGLARRGDPNLTTAGSKVGTPFYMSPEQVLADPSQIGPEADQYGLGVVLYELLCGRLPFEGPTAESVYPMILAGSPPNPRTFDPTLPPGLADACLKALAANPKHRWESSAAFGNAIRPWIEVENDAAPPPPLDATALPTPKTRSNSALKPKPTPETSTLPPDVSTAARIDAIKEKGRALGEKGRAMAGRLKGTIDEGRTSIEPLVQSVRPLGASIGDTMRLSTSALKSRWPRWMQGGVGWIKGWIDLLNESLRKIEPPTPPSASTDDTRDHPSPRPESSIRPHEPPPASPVRSTGPIPLNASTSTPPETPRAWPGPAGPAVSRADDPRELAYFNALHAARQSWKTHDRDVAVSHLDRCPPDLRGWEWAYLRALCQSKVATLGEQAGEVGALAFDRLGRILAAGEEGGVRLWDALDRRVLGRYAAQLKRIDAVALTPDGRWLASAGGRVVRVWSLDSPNPDSPAHTLAGHDAMVTRLAFAADGVHLASASLDQTVRLWDFRRDRERGNPLSASSAVSALAFHPLEPSWLAAGCADGSVVLWDADESIAVSQGSTPANAPVTDLAFHPSGRHLAVGSRDGSLSFLDSRTLSPLASLDTRLGPVSALAFHPVGKYLASLGGPRERTLRISAVDPDGPPGDLGRPLASIPFGATSLTSLAFAPGASGKLALAGGHDRTVKLWDDPAFWTSLASRPGGDRARAVAIHPGGRHLAVARLDGSIEVQALASTSTPRVLAHAGPLIRALAFQPGEFLLASAGDDGLVTFWDVAVGEPVSRLDAHSGPLLALAFSPDGDRLATVGLEGQVSIWDARHPTTSPLQTLETSASTAAFALTPDGLRLATAGPDKHVHVWDPLTGHRLASLEGHTRRITTLAPSPDFRHLVSVGEDRTLFLWSLALLQPLLTLHDLDPLPSLAWHPTAQSLAAISEDASLLLESPTAPAPRHDQPRPRSPLAS